MAIERLVYGRTILCGDCKWRAQIFSISHIEVFGHTRWDEGGSLDTKIK